jgi:RND family efflux transporter MFP subunit
VRQDLDTEELRELEGDHRVEPTLAETRSRQDSDFRKKRRKKGWILVIVIAAAALLGFMILRNYLPGTPATSATTSQGRAVAKPAVDIQVLKAQRQDMSYEVMLPGTVAPIAQTTIYSKVAGYVNKMLHDKGDRVKKGELLAVVDDPELYAQYEKSVSDFEIKQVTYERLYNVWKSTPDVIAKQDVDVAQANYQAAKHGMNQLKAMLQYAEIRAPFSGVITARFLDIGTLVQAATASATAATPLYTIMDIDHVKVYVNVPQADVPKAKPGRSIVLSVKELPGKPFKGNITRTTIALDAITRTMLVECDIVNPEHLLQPGMFTYVTLELDKHSRALSLPSQTILKNETGQKFVFVVEDGKAKKKVVKTGIEAKGWIEITEGLDDQDDVVVLGKSRMTEGQPVNPNPYNVPAGTPAFQPR